MRNTIQQIELNIAEAKKIVDLGQALNRLENNRDFKKLILEGFFSHEAVRLVHLKADPNFQTPERQQSINTQMDAIGSLAQYFNTVNRNAALAAKSIDADEQTRDELLVEEL